MTFETGLGIGLFLRHFATAAQLAVRFARFFVQPIATGLAIVPAAAERPLAAFWLPPRLFASLLQASAGLVGWLPNPCWFEPWLAPESISASFDRLIPLSLPRAS